jgi:hypothetical protein
MRNEVTLNTCHDIRHWMPCAICNGIGDDRRMLKIGKAMMHGACAVESMTEAAVLALPVKERDKLTMGDCGVKLMRKLLEAR